MPETVETSPPEDGTSSYASLLATGERVLLVRRRHWLTFLEAGRWFVLALGAGIAALVLGQAVGFLGSLLDWAFWIFVTIGLLGVAWTSSPGEPSATSSRPAALSRRAA